MDFIFDPYFLIILSLLTSSVTAIFGVGGGFLLLALMPLYLPFSTVIPLHGVVQLVSNTSRFMVDLKTVKWSLVPSYAVGTFIGAGAGYFFLGSISETYLPLILGVFILLINWTPITKALGKWLHNLGLVATIQSFLSLFVGSTGLLSPPILISQGLSKDEVIVTHAVHMSLMHCLKITVFAFAGVTLLEHSVLLSGMIIASITGSWLGKKLRGKIPEKRGVFILKILITLLALKLAASPFV